MILTADQLTDFLWELRERHGFTVGVREALRAEHVRRLLDASAPVGREGWAVHIAPVVCGSQEEQQALRRALDEYCQRANIPDTAAGPKNARAEQSGPSESRARRRHTTIALLSAGVILLITALAFAAWWLGWFDQPIVEQDPVNPPQPKPPSRSYRTDFLGILALVAPSVFLLFFLCWLWERRQSFARRLRPRSAASSGYRFGHTTARHFPLAQTARFMHAFWARWALGAPEFAATPTIQSASLRAGFVEPRFQRRTIAPHYIVLIRQRGRADHLATIGLEFCTLLEASGSNLECFTYVGQPSLLKRLDLNAANEAGAKRTTETVTLEDALAQAPEAAVFLVDDGSSLFDAITLEPTAEAVQILENRRIVAVLSPTVTDGWGLRERVLDDIGFLVMPCDSRGIGELSRIVADINRTDVSRVDPLIYGAERRNLARRHEDYPRLLRADADRFVASHIPPLAQVCELADELRRYLGPNGYIWLTALAVYPTIQPDLTSEIGDSLGRLQGRPSDPQTYLAIARLPWVTQGGFPDWLRRHLLGSLEAEERQLVGDAIAGILAHPSARGLVLLDIGRQPWSWNPAVVWQRAARSVATARDNFVFTRFVTPSKSLTFLETPSWMQRNARWRRWLAPAAAVTLTVAVTAFFAVFAFASDEVMAVSGILIVFGLMLWHALRAHLRDDTISKTGLCLSLLVLAAIAATPFVIPGRILWPMVYLGGFFATTLAGRLLIQSSFLEFELGAIHETAVAWARAPWTSGATLCLLPIASWGIEQYAGFGTLKEWGLETPVALGATVQPLMWILLSISARRLVLAKAFFGWLATATIGIQFVSVITALLWVDFAKGAAPPWQSAVAGIACAAVGATSAKLLLRRLDVEAAWLRLFATALPAVIMGAYATVLGSKGTGSPLPMTLLGTTWIPLFIATMVPAFVTAHRNWAALMIATAYGGLALSCWLLFSDPFVMLAAYALSATGLLCILLSMVSGGLFASIEQPPQRQEPVPRSTAA